MTSGTLRSQRCPSGTPRSLPMAPPLLNPRLCPWPPSVIVAILHAGCRARCACHPSPPTSHLRTLPTPPQHNGSCRGFECGVACSGAARGGVEARPCAECTAGIVEQVDYPALLAAAGLAPDGMRPKAFPSVVSVGTGANGKMYAPGQFLPSVAQSPAIVSGFARDCGHRLVAVLEECPAVYASVAATLHGQLALYLAVDANKLVVRTGRGAAAVSRYHEGGVARWDHGVAAGHRLVDRCAVLHQPVALQLLVRGRGAAPAGAEGGRGALRPRRRVQRVGAAWADAERAA